MSAVVAAIAASIGVVLSAATLVVAGRRETKKWIREQTLDTLYDFTKGSFEGQITPAWKARIGRVADLSTFNVRYQTAHQAKQAALNRLRLTADPGVIRAAQALLDYEADFHAFVFDTPQPLGDHQREFDWRKRKQKELRDELLNEARKNLKLKPGPPLP